MQSSNVKYIYSLNKNLLNNKNHKDKFLYYNPFHFFFFFSAGWILVLGCKESNLRVRILII